MIMIDNKDNEIILCKGIKMDRNYENVLSYSESDMVTLCRNNAIYEADKYNFIEKANNRIVIDHPYSSAMYSNYVAFKNPRFGNKWIFAWVTDVKLINIGSTEITFEVDVWSTWYSRFNIGQAFIEREHVEDDTFGKHTIFENLETGEYTIKSETDASDLDDVCPVVCATIDPEMNKTYSSYCGNRYESLNYFIFKRGGDTGYDPSSQEFAINEYLKQVNSNYSNDSVVSIFMAPRKLVDWKIGNTTPATTWQSFPTSQAVTDCYYKSALDVFTYQNQQEQYITDYDKPVKFTDLSVTRPTTFGSYTPVNNKCYCYPFQYLNLSNNNGGNVKYDYEDFNSNTPTFELTGILTPSCSIRAVPKNYKNQTLCYNEGLQGAKYPICSWSNDLFTNYMTQQGVNIPLEITKDVITMGIGAGVGLATGGAGLAIGASVIASGASNVISTMQQIKQHELIPPQARGNTNGADVGAANNKITFTAQLIQVKEEYIKLIDRFFSRYGYKVNDVKTPNLLSRTGFNFIKVGGMDELVHGDIPSTDLEKINEILRKGVTIFHNYSNIGNYTISNPIVTP